jgi:HTH-type transcriptional repressor of NAD biosynthesis genes
MAERGLIVGKFYPPHRGHKYLIDFAASQVNELTVIVCQKSHESPPGELRAAWLREIHPDVNVLLIDDTYDEQDSRVWAENSIRWLGAAPDVVFTSEDYGDRFAYFLGCQHVQVDKARQVVPVSGSQVRSAPFSCWEYLEPPVRGWYARRVCLVGAESTGKTTLAQSLAEHYQTLWVPEYGREYSAQKLAREGGYFWRSEEFAHIAQTQCEREDEAARRANKVLICDTDAFATSIWHRRYHDDRSPEVECIVAAHRRPDLYLLTDVSTPFVQDGTRDGEAIREWMHQTFVEELIAQQRTYLLLTGPLQKRFDTAMEIIDHLMEED